MLEEKTRLVSLKQEGDYVFYGVQTSLNLLSIDVFGLLWSLYGVDRRHVHILNHNEVDELTVSCWQKVFNKMVVKLSFWGYYILPDVMINALKRLVPNIQTGSFTKEELSKYRFIIKIYYPASSRQQS